MADGRGRASDRRETADSANAHRACLMDARRNAGFGCGREESLFGSF